VAVVAEGLPLGPLGLEPGEDGDELGDHLVERDVILELDVEPVAQGPAAEEDGIRPGAGRAVLVAGGRSSDQADIRVIGPGAAVGTAGHPDGEELGLEAQRLQLDFELVHDRRQGPLGLGHGQAAGGHRRAGHRPSADGRKPLDLRDPVLLQHRLDLGLPGGIESGQQDRLLAGHPRGGPVLLEERPQARQEPEIPLVLDPPVLDRQAEEQLAVPLLVPAEVVVDPGHADRPRVGQLAAEVLLDLGPEGGIPQSKTRYLIRARLRSERFPWSR